MLEDIETLDMMVSPPDPDRISVSESERERENGREIDGLSERERVC